MGRALYDLIGFYFDDLIGFYFIEREDEMVDEMRLIYFKI